MSVESEFSQENFLRATHQANRARVLAHLLTPVLHEIFPHIFLEPPTIRALSGQGWSNLTVRVRNRGATTGYILRLCPRVAPPDSAPSHSVQHYEKERFILEQLQRYEFVPRAVPAGAGVLSLVIPGRGETDFAYSLQQEMPFVSGREVCTKLDREHTLTKLGAIARKIHSVRLEGYGNEFDEQTRRFKRPDFLACIEDKLSGIERSSLAVGMKRWLTARVEALAALKPESCLYHRDLLGNWGNFLVDSVGDVRGIIDWEFAGAGPALHMEIASLVYVLNRDGVTPDCVERDLSAVLSGYGVSRAEYRDCYERDVETFVLLNSVSALMKLDDLRRSGSLAKEPWRLRFAERASGLCQRCFANDRVAA